MTNLAGVPIVVGIDGSEHQQLVLEWAAAEARLQHRPLTLIHAFDWAALGLSFDAAPYGAVQKVFHARAEETRDAALALAQRTAPDVETRGVIVDGGAARVLVEASHSAALVVVGHGSTGLAAVLLGSVARQVIAHAACPAVVVRSPSGDGPEGGRVVVGLDGSPHSAPVLDFALQEASRRGIGLTAIHAWQWPVSTGPGDMLPLVYDEDDVRAEETRVLSEALAGWLEKYPDVEVRRRIVRDRPARALVTAAAGAAMLVVGARGHGGFPGLRLGSVSRAALHHAPCPVAVVHGSPT